MYNIHCERIHEPFHSVFYAKPLYIAIRLVHRLIEWQCVTKAWIMAIASEEETNAKKNT